MFYEFNRAPNFNDVEPFLKIDLNRSCYKIFAGRCKCPLGLKGRLCDTPGTKKPRDEKMLPVSQNNNNNNNNNLYNSYNIGFMDSIPEREFVYIMAEGIWIMYNDLQIIRVFV